MLRSLRPRLVPWTLVESLHRSKEMLKNAKKIVTAMTPFASRNVNLNVESYCMMAWLRSVESAIPLKTVTKGKAWHRLVKSAIPLKKWAKGKAWHRSVKSAIPLKTVAKGKAWHRSVKSAIPLKTIVIKEDADLSICRSLKLLMTL